MLTKALLKCLLLVFIIESSEQRHEIRRIPQSRSKVLAAIDGDTNEHKLTLEFCAMSSGHETCSMAIDGDINQETWSNECAITKSESKPWFRARLETPAFITRVVIYTFAQISDKGSDALTDFELWTDYQCVWHQSDASFQNKTFSCDSFSDHIEIRSHVEDGVLGLCEVVVYGKSLKVDWSGGGQSVLKVHQCRASHDDHNECGTFVDGKPDTCFETRVPALKHHVQLILYDPSVIKRIKVFARKDRMDSLKNFELDVGHQICLKHHGDAREVFEFSCALFGHVVTLTAFFQTEQNLAVCELQAIGLPTRVDAFLAPEPLGCFREKRQNRDMQQLAAINSMSLYRCEAICRRHQKPYFGLQYGSQCWCSERYGIYGRLRDDQCWMRCRGYNCGAKLANSVYKLRVADSKIQDTEVNAESE